MLAHLVANPLCYRLKPKTRANSKAILEFMRTKYEQGEIVALAENYMYQRGDSGGVEVIHRDTLTVWLSNTSQPVPLPSSLASWGFPLFQSLRSDSSIPLRDRLRAVSRDTPLFDNPPSTIIRSL